MDTEIRPREPNEKQKAAAYDRFIKTVMAQPDPGSAGYFVHVLRQYAMEAPDGSKEG